MLVSHYKFYLTYFARKIPNVPFYVAGHIPSLLISTCLPTGQHCTEDVDECRLQPNTCQNGGTCSNLMGSYVCVCVNGWSGPDCSENIDDCATAACSPGSTCVDRVAHFLCLCPYGKTGESGNQTQTPLKQTQIQ